MIHAKIKTILNQTKQENCRSKIENFMQKNNEAKNMQGAVTSSALRS